MPDAFWRPHGTSAARAGAPPAPDDLYATTPPWEIGRPQPAFRRLAEAGEIRGRVLDAGCGTGEHVLMAAGLGLDATGVDLSATALRAAERKARDRGLPARFLRHDALRLHELAERFDTVLDCALFHAFTGDRRAAYVRSLAAALPPGGRYYMLGYADPRPGGWARHRLSRDDVVAAFPTGWRLDAIEPAVIEVAVAPGALTALLVKATRT